MSSCSAYGCTNRYSKKIAGITFHKFPLNPKLRKLWVQAVKRKDWEPTQHSQLCSRHFTEDQMDRTSRSCVRLRQNAVPTIFNFPPNIKKIVEESAREQQAYKERNENSTTIQTSDNHSENLGEVSNTNFPIISSVSSHGSSLSSRFIPISLEEDEPSCCLYVREIEEDSEETHVSRTDYEDLKRKLEQSDQLLENYRKKIKSLHQQNRRYRTRLMNMKHSIFVELQKRQYLSSNMNFKNDKDGCLLDRHSIKTCDSSDSENVDEPS